MKEQSLMHHLEHVIPLVRAYTLAAKNAVAKRCSEDGKVITDLLNKEQRVLHGYAWIATTSEAIVRTAEWGLKVAASNKMHRLEELVLMVGIGEYLQQMAYGIPMSQSEIVRPHELGLNKAVATLASSPHFLWFQENGLAASSREELVARYRAGEPLCETAFDDELDMIREQFRRFTEKEITPYAHEWHLADDLIPDELVAKLAELGVFGICIPEQYDGMGMGKRAMCIVTEELSRGWIGTGSLGTRSEIAGELIYSSGTDEQKAYWLPKIASGEILPTAVFTEPDTGSDLASLRTRASQREDGSWQIDGNKTWITHAARSDLMTLLARTEPDEKGHSGLSMMLAPKIRGTDENPFPSDGMSGSEIPVLGYRGMKEYELGFDGFVVPADAVLGGTRGYGFRQLMKTFEGARIQTAARAVGVAWRAFELAWQYAVDRKQFGRSIVEFPRVSDKLAIMLAETVMAREVTYFAAEEKEKGHRCDIEAGMAKLIAARVAWSNADLGLQIHGGNGYAQEYEISRVLCDARILNIFEGAAEIQAQVIGRGLLTR